MQVGHVHPRLKYAPGLRGSQALSSPHVAFHVDRLAERGVLLAEPNTKQVDGKLRELQLDLGRRAMRITYWIASGRRIILLTVFVKNEDRERAGCSGD